MPACCIYIFLWVKCLLPFSPEMHRDAVSVRRPCATYGSLNGSQAQIAHHCLEPELPGEGEREEN